MGTILRNSNSVRRVHSQRKIRGNKHFRFRDTFGRPSPVTVRLHSHDDGLCAAGRGTPCPSGIVVYLEYHRDDLCLHLAHCREDIGVQRVRDAIPIECRNDDLLQIRSAIWMQNSAFKRCLGYKELCTHDTRRQRPCRGASRRARQPARPSSPSRQGSNRDCFPVQEETSTVSRQNLGEPSSFRCRAWLCSARSQPSSSQKDSAMRAGSFPTSACAATLGPSELSCRMIEYWSYAPGGPICRDPGASAGHRVRADDVAP